jgi:hypothetical protein
MMRSAMSSNPLCSTAGERNRRGSLQHFLVRPLLKRLSPHRHHFCDEVDLEFPSSTHSPLAHRMLKNFRSPVVLLNLTAIATATPGIQVLGVAFFPVEV